MIGKTTKTLESPLRGEGEAIFNFDTKSVRLLYLGMFIHVGNMVMHKLQRKKEIETP